jgi:hypothetical protein
MPKKNAHLPENDPQHENELGSAAGKRNSPPQFRDGLFLSGKSRVS